MCEPSLGRCEPVQNSNIVLKAADRFYCILLALQRGNFRGAFLCKTNLTTMMLAKSDKSFNSNNIQSNVECTKAHQGEVFFTGLILHSGQSIKIQSRCTKII